MTSFTGFRSGEIPLTFILIAVIFIGQQIVGGIFAVSTYNTDYILTKEENFDKALDALKSAGYEVRGYDQP